MYWPGRLVGVAAAVHDDGGRILLVRHTYGRLNWELPGGASEPGESFEETALRELQEETGLAGRVDRLAGIYYRREDDSHHLVFVARSRTAPSPFRVQRRSRLVGIGQPTSHRDQSATSRSGGSRTRWPPNPRAWWKCPR
jgi:8-oxo-dGTP pyrophosphatase MutT (NUDIX family)